jgi:hypothetical protein
MQPITAYAEELEIGRLANAARMEIIRRADSPFRLSATGRSPSRCAVSDARCMAVSHQGTTGR